MRRLFLPSHCRLLPLSTSTATRSPYTAAPSSIRVLQSQCDAPHSSQIRTTHTVFTSEQFTVERVNGEHLQHMPQSLRTNESWKERQSDVVDVGIHVAVLSRMENGVFAFMRRYRPAVDDTVLELPSMSLAQYDAYTKQTLREWGKSDETFEYGPKDVAMFILQDQLGMAADESDLVPMFEFYMSPGISNERLLVYYNEKNLDMTEDPEAHARRIENEHGATIEYMGMIAIKNGIMEAKFIDGKTATALAQYLLSISEQQVEQKLGARQQKMLGLGLAIGAVIGVILTFFITDSMGIGNTSKKNQRF